ncbi:MAG: phosphoribosylaminoimidazole-succinocarboxamide synthase [Candidatus Xenobia bacterium]
MNASLATFERSTLPLPDRREGKVRDSYALGQARRLFVTTDRLSAFDRVLGCVPYKGQVLNQLAAWWFERTGHILANHALSVPDENALVAREATPLPVEIIVRGYITGVTETSLWYRYSLGERTIYGHQLPDGLTMDQKLPEPLLTPTTKGGPTGHDERLTCRQVTEEGHLDEATWEKASQAALALFAFGSETARERGLTLVDSKYEFGTTAEGELILIDEVHTPDSSRFWKDGENLDKEFVRRAFAEQGYRGEGEPPAMPPELWQRASKLYISIFELLTGQGFVPGQQPVGPRLERNLRQEGWL